MDRPSRPVNATLPYSKRAVRRQGSRLVPGKVRPLALVATLLLGGLLGGCSLFRSPEVQRGHRISEDLLRDITPGVQSKADVQTLLGSPSQTSTFSDNQWYYISSRTRQRPGRELAVTDQQTVVVEFDGRGVVREIRTLTEADGRPVTMVSRETPTPGNDRTLLQALFGNVGRIGTGGAQANAGPGTAGPAIGQPR